MYDHVGLPVRDLEASRRFYDQALGPFGAKVAMELEDGVLYGLESGVLFALRKRDQVAPVHVAFRSDREGVRAFHEAALAAGGTDNGGPGVRPHYGESYYAAYVLDPDGHNIEVVSHAPE